MNLCDVCFWRKRAEKLEKVNVKLVTALEAFVDLGDRPPDNICGDDEGVWMLDYNNGKAALALAEEESE